MRTGACVKAEPEGRAYCCVDPRLYFLMRRLRAFSMKHFPGQKIRLLDVGCADGSFMRIVSENLCDVVERVDGADVPSRWLERGSVTRAGKLYVHDFENDRGDKPEVRYHVATLWEVVEHIEDVYAFLRNLKGVLAPGGAVLLSSPNLLSLSRFVKRQRWVGVAETDHKYLFDARTIEMVLTRAGFKDARARAYFFPSLGPRMDGCNGILSSLPGGGMLYAEAFKK